MSSDTYRLLLRNGQAIEISEAYPLDPEVRFVSAVQLTCPQSAWLQRTSDGSMVEVSLTSATPGVAVWRYRAEIASPTEHRTPLRGSGWGLLRLLKKS